MVCTNSVNAARGAEAERHSMTARHTPGGRRRGSVTRQPRRLSPMGECVFAVLLIGVAVGGVAVVIFVPSLWWVGGWLVLSAGTTLVAYPARQLGAFADLQDLLGVFRSAKARSEEHTSELQSLRHLVCRLLLEK